MQHKNTINQIIDEKKELIQLVLVAVVLTISLGLLTNLVAAKLAFWTVWIFAFASIVCLGAFINRLVKKLSFDEEVSAVVFFRPTKNSLVSVKGYDFAQDMARTIRAIEAENKSIFSNWANDPLSKPREPAAPTEGEREKQYIAILRVNVEDSELPQKPRSVELLEETAQFCLLESLSTHLRDYFDHTDSGAIEELQRKDIPELLHANRVLNLLTTPIEQRDVFIEAFPDPDKRPRGEVHSLWSSDGAIYNRFDLVLPKNSTVTIPETKTVRLETKRLSVEIKVGYPGTSVNTPPLFEEAYLKIPGHEIETRHLIVELRGRIKPLALLSSKGWADYQWIDSFRVRVRSEWDFEEFLRRINWTSIEAMLYCQRKSK
ncbi:hypothetical protein IV99_11955 [Pectobacterium brasiliense]|uniref:hypothetical protein n=1 Tax=Pectobacterium brasiliense TaxID=180957 RepID=UPI0004E7947B|nr:hypothetical protein [Pectobacterium brasiliense]KFF64869.1 hypothetical protein IV99_11955 [Pectobacterium brasiliense]